MCGIYGFYSIGKNKILEEEQLKLMGASLNHRGPDDNGIFYGNHVALGNQRLSIIDIQGGHQPFCSSNEDVFVVQNGEIYNYIELTEELVRSGINTNTSCDTEVILHLYMKFGIDFIYKLNGMFSVAIYDKRIDSLFLIRDRMGIKPLYFYFKSNNLIFSSEIKSILQCGIDNSIAYESIDYYLSFNYIPPPMTMFKYINHLEPGHWMCINSNGITKKQWWDISKIQTVNRNEQDWIELFNSKLDKSIQIRMRADVPFGAFLSGGVDSSTVVGKMSNYSTTPIKTYNIGFHDKAYDESPFANEAALRFGTEHTSQIVDSEISKLWPFFIYHADQPHGDISFIPTYQLAKLARRDVKMVLTGDGADELFAGYDKYKTFFANPENTSTSSKFRENYYNNLLLFKDSDRTHLYLHSTTNPKDYLFEKLNRVKHMDYINQALYLDCDMLLPGNNLVKPDKMGMATSLEARVPFLDYNMVELAFSMPGQLKLYHNETKYIYKKAVVDLIGDNLAYRKKQMFTVPIGEWFKNELKEYLQGILFSTSCQNRNLFNLDMVERLYTEHTEGKLNHTRQLRALVSLEIWFRKFLD